MDEVSKSLPAELRDYIRAREKVAFAEGYAAAKGETMMASLGQQASIAGTVATTSPVISPDATKRASAATQGPPSKARHIVAEQSTATPKLNLEPLFSGGPMFGLPRGMPEMLVEEAYRAIAPKQVAPVQIAAEVLRLKQVTLPKASLSRVCSRLEEKGVLGRVKGTAAFYYIPEHERGKDRPSGVVVDLAKRGT